MQHSVQPKSCTNIYGCPCWAAHIYVAHFFLCMLYDIVKHIRELCIWALAGVALPFCGSSYLNSASFRYIQLYWATGCCGRWYKLNFTEVLGVSTCNIVNILRVRVYTREYPKNAGDTRKKYSRVYTRDNTIKGTNDPF